MEGTAIRSAAIGGHLARNARCTLTDTLGEPLRAAVWMSSSLARNAFLRDDEVVEGQRRARWKMKGHWEMLHEEQ